MILSRDLSVCCLFVVAAVVGGGGSSDGSGSYACDMMVRMRMNDMYTVVHLN